MFYRNDVNRSSVVGATALAFLAGAAVWAVFGDKLKRHLTKNSEFQDLKDQVYKKASEISDLTKEKYEELVDDAADKYARAKGISQNELVDLVDDLKIHWSRISRAWKNN